MPNPTQQQFNPKDLSKLNPYIIPTVDPSIRYEIEKRRQADIDELNRQLTAGTNDVNAQFINDNSANLARNELVQKEAGQGIAMSQRDWLAEQEKIAKSQRVKGLKSRAQQRLASLQSALLSDKEKLANKAAASGLKNEGIFGKAADEVSNAYLSKENEISADLENSIAEIENNFTKSLFTINQQAEDRKAALESNYQNNVLRIQEASGMKAKDKANLLMKLRDQLVDGKRDIQDRYDNLVSAELNSANRDFQNELALANITGTYKGDPTLNAQEEENDLAYRNEILKQNQQKIDIARAKANRSGSSGTAVNQNRIDTAIQNALTQAKKTGGSILSEAQVQALGLNSKEKPLFYAGINNAIVNNQVPYDPKQMYTPQKGKMSAADQLIADMAARRAAESAQGVQK